MKEREERAGRCRSRTEWFEALKSRGIQIQRAHYPNRDGGLTAFSLFEARAGSDLTLLVHGTGNDHLFSLQALIEALLTAGQSVLSVDLPGHGTESSTVLKSETFWESAEDLKIFLAVKGLQDRRLNAVGYSLGGVFLLNALESGQLSFHKIVLMAVPLHAKIGASFLWQEFLSLFSPSFRKQWRDYGWTETIPAFGRFRREDFPLRLDPSYPRSYPRFVDELLTSRPPLTSTQKISQKCLFIFGAKDRLAPPSDSVHWRSLLGEVNGLVVDRANHFLLPLQKTTIDAITHWMTS